MAAIPPAVNIAAILEAVASTALSHPDHCTCDPCRATSGDQDALTRIIEATHQETKPNG